MESKPPKIHVLIVGGGIGGLMLGLMLEKAEISYQILERSPEHRPLGSSISLNGTVLRLFEQLGLLEDVYNISKITGRLHLVKEDLEIQGHVDLEHFRARYGYNNIAFGRPDLFKVLVRHIPPRKLLMGKRILSTSQTELGVMVRCQDGSTYHGDVLVGADGAYSSVRQCMHKSLKDEGLLPKADSEKLHFDQHCVVGITDELSPEKYPILKAESCDVYGVLGKKRPYAIWLIPITGNRFAWSISGRILDSEVGHEDVRSFSFAEWCPEMATDLCDIVRDYSMPDFSVSSQQDGFYKHVYLGDEDIHDDIPLSETASMSDGESCHSGVPSENSPASSSASSTCADCHSAYHPTPTHSCTSSRRSSHQHSPEALSQIHPLSRAPTTTSNLSTESPSVVPPRRKSPPAKPGTVAEIIDATNPDRISKVMLESKLFKVWHHGRTVLLGDACHKLLPFAGQGAIQAILDGISLTNALYDIQSNSMADINKAFKRYSTERLPIARGAVMGSRSFGKLFNTQGRLSDFIRKISFSRVPPWILKMATDKLHLHRPQLTFMQMVPDRGSAKAHKQEYSPRYVDRVLRGRQASQERVNNPTDYTLPTAPTAPTAPTVAAAATAAAEANAESQHTDTEDAPHRDGHHREGHRSKSHHRHHRVHTGSLSLDPDGSSRNPSRSLVPPPLPLEAPPRHHPAAYMNFHPEERLGYPAPSPSYSRSSSVYSSPSSSSFSLSSIHALEEVVYLQSLSPPRSRRATNSTTPSRRPSEPSTPRSRSRSRSRTREIAVPHPISLPPPCDNNHFQRSPDRICSNCCSIYSNSSNGQPFTPPRSPLAATPPVNAYDLDTTPITGQFRKTHKRTKSLQMDSLLASGIQALEQTTVIMKERAKLREQRSLDQMRNVSTMRTANDAAALPPLPPVHVKAPKAKSP